MNYSNFREELLNEVKRLVEDDALVTMHSNVKNNGVTRYAISIKKEGDYCIPTIYLESFYEKYNEGNKDITELAIMLKNEYRTYCEMNRPDFDIEGFSSYENVKDRIFFKIINKERNIELLKKVPHKEFLDLAIVYYYLFNESDEGNHTTLINQTYFKMWEIDDEELYKIAVRNTLIKYQVSFKSITKVISDIYDVDEICDLGKESNENENQNQTIKLCDIKGLVDVVEENDITHMFDDVLNQILNIGDEGMYILTSQNTLFGAGAMLYKPILKMISYKLQDDIYILPSSIHEGATRFAA